MNYITKFNIRFFTTDKLFEFKAPSHKLKRLFCTKTLVVHAGSNIQCGFSMATKVFVYLNHLKLPQISQTYLTITVYKIQFVDLKIFIKTSVDNLVLTI